MSFLGIDLGTTFIKGAVLDLESRRLEHVGARRFRRRLPMRTPCFARLTLTRS